jgi:hypothetical protein
LSEKQTDQFYHEASHSRNFLAGMMLRMESIFLLVLAVLPDRVLPVPVVWGIFRSELLLDRRRQAFLIVKDQSLFTVCAKHNF